MTFDDLADESWIQLRDRRQFRDGVIEILGVFPDDRDREGVPVVDEDAPVPIEEHAARGTQRDRALKKVMEDKRVAKWMNPSNMPFDGKRMIWGGFKPIVRL